jgi:hypothetical protein
MKIETVVSASTKPFLLSHNLAHLFLQKGRQKPNKLNYLTHTTRRAFSTILRISRPLIQRRSATAYGIFLVIGFTAHQNILN